MIKIGVISDTHIPDRIKVVPEKILEAFKHVDMVIHAGDLVDLSVLEDLKSVCKNVHAVYGNMDPYNVKKVLPENKIIHVDKYKIGLMHGLGNPLHLVETTRQFFKNDKVDIIIFGHSHKPFCESIDNILFFNPGSATDTIFAAFNSYGIIEINDKINAKIVKL